MDPEWAPVLGAALGALAAILTNSNMRSILRAVFRRPRETSVIYRIGRKRTEVSSSQVTQEDIGPRLVERLTATGLSDVQAAALAAAILESLAKGRVEPTRAGETRAAAGSESDE